MAETVKPIFFPDVDTVSRLLHLQNLPGGSPSADKLEHAVLQSATTFWKELGAVTVASLQALTRTVPPVTDDDYKRLLAEQTELDVIRYHLAALVPLSYREGQADFRETWNSESGFKELSPAQTEKVRATWWNDPERGIAYRLLLLAGKSLPGSTGVGMIAAVGMDEGVDPDTGLARDKDDVTHLYNVSYYRGFRKISIKNLLDAVA